MPVISGDICSFDKQVDDNRFRRLAAISQRLEALKKRCPQLFVKDTYRFPPLDTIGRGFKSINN